MKRVWSSSIAMLMLVAAAGMTHAATAGAGASAATTTTAKATTAPTHAVAKSAQPMAHSTKAAVHKEMLDLNSASREELMKLPGVGEAIADKIIAARPFKSRAELLSKNLVTKTEYRKIRTSVTAKQS